jgi:serine/threonine protein kinase
MNNPYIVKIFEAFETENHVYLVMDYVSGGSLHSFLKERSDRRLKEEEAR